MAKNSSIIANGNFSIGVDYNLPLKTVLEIGENGVLVINGPVSINKGCKILILPNAKLEIGEYSSVGENSRIVCCEKITIGNGCRISWNVNLIDSDVHHIISCKYTPPNTKEIILKNDVWIGFNSIILKGATIGKSSIVGAGSVVTKSIPPNCLSAGNPNKIIKENIDWKP